MNFETGKLTIERSDWKGHVTTTKGGRVRHVGMTRRLAVALQRCRSLRSRRVLCQDDGEPLTQKMVQDHVRRAARRAQVKPDGVHVLRHTFCSHLAIRGAPTRAIQELAGHQDISTTQRYIHLSPAAADRAIALLERDHAFTPGTTISSSMGRRVFPWIYPSAKTSWTASSQAGLAEA